MFEFWLRNPCVSRCLIKSGALRDHPHHASLECCNHRQPRVPTSRPYQMFACKIPPLKQNMHSTSADNVPRVDTMSERELRTSLYCLLVLDRFTVRSLFVIHSMSIFHKMMRRVLVHQISRRTSWHHSCVAAWL